jgi:diguanylate cyclase (GGDEF)-like protein
MEKPFALIIEDDRDTAALFRQVLELAGFQTEIIMMGKIALERLAVLTPDIVLLDLHLPGISGMDILNQVRADERLTETRVVIVTAHSHLAESLQAEADLVLLKPISIDQLTDLVLRLHPTDEQVPQNAPFNALTGLYNRSFFMSRLQYAIDRAKQLDNHLYGLLYLDCDRFKSINDTYGQEAGDDLLVHIGKSLKTCLRPTDTISHFRGDNFVILLEDIKSPKDPIQIAKRIQKEVTAFEREGKVIDFSLSIGVVVCDASRDLPADNLRDANIAMYHAKESGGACYEVFQPSMEDPFIQQPELEENFRLSVSEDE